MYRNENYYMIELKKYQQIHNININIVHIVCEFLRYKRIQCMCKYHIRGENDNVIVYHNGFIDYDKLYNYNEMSKYQFLFVPYLAVFTNTMKFKEWLCYNCGQNEDT